MQKRVLIKICGICDIQMAEYAVDRGAHYIGLVFHPSSKRAVSIERAKVIAQATRQTGGIPVAVLVNQEAKEIEDICTATGISTVQLHGDIAKEQEPILPSNLQRIYVCSVNADGSVNNVQKIGIDNLNRERDFLLFDGLQPGTGQPFNWSNFIYQEHFRWFLSGGLSPSNVKTALKQLDPTGVDVSSGVENEPGHKNKELINHFIQETKL